MYRTSDDVGWVTDRPGRVPTPVLSGPQLADVLPPSRTSTTLSNEGYLVTSRPAHVARYRLFSLRTTEPSCPVLKISQTPDPSVHIIKGRRHIV